VTFEPDADQAAAINDVHRWYREGGQGVYRLFGYAGTGKSTVARHIADRLGVTPLYAAYSGKAASVLRSKGAYGAQTIHSLIYKPVGKSREELNQLELDLRAEKDPAEVRRIEARIREVEAEIAKPSWSLNLDSELRSAELLILDEVSMVGDWMARDLESFGTPILCLGDPAQLPPVKGTGYYTDAKPDMLLTRIHRSAEDSPVTRLATLARRSRGEGFGVTGMDGNSGRLGAGEKVSLRDFDQVLVGKNATRSERMYRRAQSRVSGS
jgi:exodeoxyribonuclease-5